MSSMDIDAGKVWAITAGESYIEDVHSDRLAAAGARITATTEIEPLREADAILICVPTPLNRNRGPDTSYIVATGRAVAPHLAEGTLVVLESTPYPGTPDGELRAGVEEGAGREGGTAGVGVSGGVRGRGPPVKAAGA